MATTLEMLEQGSAVTLLSTELNSLANNTMCSAGSAQTNTQATSNFNGYVRGKIELNIGAPGGTLTANSTVDFWFLKTVDGSNYEDGSSSVTPQRIPDVVFPMRNVSTAQRIVRECWVPVGTWKPIAKNDGTGQTLASSGNTIKIILNTDQSV